MLLCENDASIPLLWHRVSSCPPFGQGNADTRWGYYWELCIDEYVVAVAWSYALHPVTIHPREWRCEVGTHIRFLPKRFYESTESLPLALEDELGRDFFLRVRLRHVIWYRDEHGMYITAAPNVSENAVHCVIHFFRPTTLFTNTYALGIPTSPTQERTRTTFLSTERSVASASREGVTSNVRTNLLFCYLVCRLTPGRRRIATFVHIVEGAIHAPFQFIVHLVFGPRLQVQVLQPFKVAHHGTTRIAKNVGKNVHVFRGQ